MTIQASEDAWGAIRAGVPAHLQEACDLANTMAYAVRMERATCVLTSHALAAYLREALGLNPRLERVETHIHPQCRCPQNCHGIRCTGAALGWDGDGSRQRAAAPGYWRGHLAVICEGFLLDPTIDQVNNGVVHLRPLVLPLPGGWDDGRGAAILNDPEGTFVRYSRYHRQAGWKSAGDARPSHWRPVTDLMVMGARQWGVAGAEPPRQ